MGESHNRLDREQMIFQIMMNTKYTEDALQKLSNEKLNEMYVAKVEFRGEEDAGH